MLDASWYVEAPPFSTYSLRSTAYSLFMLSIRLATEADLPAINEIYNHYVPISTTTYDVQPMGMEERRRWFAGRESIHPITVAVRESPSPPGRGQGEGESQSAQPSPGSSVQPPASPPIVGWGSLHTFRNKSGYRMTVENSVYVHPEHQRTGVGSAIILDQIERARQLGLHAIVAGIDAEQEASLALHYKHGFREVGRFPQVGRKFDRWLDAVFMELLL
jgi:L-amino acid N-acyltransferase YncA